MTQLFLEHPSSLAHETGAHPEQPARILAVERELASRGWLGFERMRSPAVERSVLMEVHPEAHIDAIERMSERGGAQLDPDTVVSPGSFVAAMHAAGGAVRMVDLLLDGDVECAFSAHRPPGHHALPARAMGFCLFNNIAIAARYALAHRGLERVMIVDWDVHHGNGTNDIFNSSREVLFVSIHQSPLYPGSGSASDVGSGDGRGFTVNLPVPAGSGDAVFESLVEHVVVPLGRSFAPQLVLISAGYDAHRQDPLAGCDVTDAGFAAMARSLRRMCASIDAPLGAVLEGGYALGALARSVAATMEAMAAPAPVHAAATGDGTVGEAPEARAARERLAQWWDGIA